jgi:hypothetical protein
LLAIKLTALVREHLGREIATLPESGVATDGSSRQAFGAGAGSIVDGTAWVLLDEQPERGLGAALAWASRFPEVTSISLIAESGTGVLARRARLFNIPITVWHPVDRTLVEAVADIYPSPSQIDAGHEQWRSVIAQAGAEPVVEHGVLAGEVRGLEVCRVVTDAYTGDIRLEVGVGAHDREAFTMMHGNRPTLEALTDVVEAVISHRAVGAPLHPLNRLGAERFVRWQVINAPQRVGAAALRAADPPLPRRNLKDAVPCVAVGESASGEPIIVVCSVGIDLDLVPFAVDAREMHAPGATLMVVVPERDASPVTRRVAELTSDPVTMITWDEFAAIIPPSP